MAYIFHETLYKYTHSILVMVLSTGLNLV